MKKALSLILALIMCLSLCACGGNDSSGTDSSGTDTTGADEGNSASEKLDISTYPFVGTWANEGSTVYLRVKEDGSISAESILVNNKTSTVNGVTTTRVEKSIRETGTYSWSMENDKFIFNNTASYTPTLENGVYTLVGEKTTYTRVGDLDFVIPLDEETTEDSGNIAEKAVEYTVGTVIEAEGFELTFTECGVEADIRISSNTSGIKITAGPSVETGKQYVYLKGTLKNTGKTALRSAIGGKAYLDDYEFDISTDIITTSGSPTYKVEPLETVNFIIYAKISDEMADIFTEGKIVFGFNDNFADVEISNAQYLYYANVSR